MFYFFIAFITSLLCTLLVRWGAAYLGVVDRPDGERKKHIRAVPLLGGVAIFIAFWILIFYLLVFNPILGIRLLNVKLFATFVASCIVMVVGITDDVHPYSAWLRLLLTAGAIAVALLLGLQLEKITNPWGGIIELSNIFGNAIIFLWLMGMMFTTKILDGLDGLTAGVVMIGALMIFFLTSTIRFYQPNVGLVALVLAGACLGFLVFNFYPAKIFLGESGSLFTGFMLGVLAIISGSKVMTALLVMAVPIADLARVMYIRLRRQQSILKGDREHLHFLLVDRGWKEWQAVLFFYSIAIVFGISTLFLQSAEKLIILTILIVFMVTIGWKLSPKHGR